MKIIADLHIHSKYSRATSPKMEVQTLDLWAQKKGINLLATGDITHPKYLQELKDNLTEDGSGFLHLKNSKKTKFVLCGEISCIYKQGEKTRRIHLLILVPDFKTIEKINKELEKRKCNLKSDGRPIIGLRAKELAQICFEANEKTLVIPAHIWTPWFALFGSKSGFDTMEECFEELAPNIYAIETGLSSDPAMNWRWSALDDIAIISNSDAHSPLTLGREANVFDWDKVSFDELRNTLKNNDPKRFLYTIEFHPEEGKYHYDGHRSCDICFSPAESLKHKNICPVCKKPLILGVDHQVETLADRDSDYQPKDRIPFKSMIPLYEIIAECFGVGKGSKRVMALYEKMLEEAGTEFKILLDLSREEITKYSNEMIAEAVIRMRKGKVHKTPGYDGVFGQIKVFSPEEMEKLKPKQKEMF